MRFKIENFKNYTIVPNDYLRDKRLSLTDKGLLTIMYSLPNDWDYTMNGLCKITNTGITRIRNCINSLEIFGYLKREQTRDEKGKIDYIYYVYLTPKKGPLQNFKSSISYRRTSTLHRI